VEFAGGVIGAPPSTAYAGDTTSKLNVRLASAVTRRELNEMIEVFTSLPPFRLSQYALFCLLQRLRHKIQKESAVSMPAD